MGIKHRPEEKGREKRKETGKKEGDKRSKERKKTRVGREIEDAPWRRRGLNQGEERCGVSSLPRVWARSYANTREKKKAKQRGWETLGVGKNKAGYTAQDAPSMRIFHLQK